MPSYVETMTGDLSQRMQEFVQKLMLRAARKEKL